MTTPNARAAFVAEEERSDVTKLSKRLRPDVEAAPWVIAEVKALEAEVKRLTAALLAVLARVDGEWDHPALREYGDLGVMRPDVRRIVSAALVAGKETT